MKDAAQRTRIRSFPLGKTGGLIEAPVVRIALAKALGFRWVKPAASLKHSLFSGLRVPTQKFPLGKTGGLIEARTVRGTEAPTHRVSAG